MKYVKIYGTAKPRKTTTHTQRYWKTRKDGVRQRYHRKVTKTQAYGKAQYIEKKVKATKEDIAKFWNKWKWEKYEVKTP